MEYQWMLLSLLGLLLGTVVGWVQGAAPLKKKVQVLQKVIELESAQRMERVLRLESALRWEKKKAQELELELKSAQARVMVLELDLERVQSKYLWKE